jgi:arabinose-5-phosphate isomerase
LALGDALAVAVIELREFNSEDFLKFHPGRKLGAQLARVSNLMHDGDALPLIGADMPISDVLTTMISKGFGIAVTTSEDGRLNGVITDGDLRHNMGNLMAMNAGQIANPSPVAVTPDLFAVQALTLLNDRKISALMVIDNQEKPVDVLQIHDLLRAVVA